MIGDFNIKSWRPRIWKYGAAALISFLSAYTAAANPLTMDAQNPMPLYPIIISQTGWLNTSRPLTAQDLEGRIILLDFWTFCCINCMHVIPDLKYLEDTFGDKLTVIGVHSAKFKNEQDTDNIRSAILRYDIHHPVVNDFNFSIWHQFGVRAWPTFVLINPKGTIEAAYSGEGNREEAEADIRKLIAHYDGKLVTAPLPMALEKDKTPPSLLSFPGKITTSGNLSDPQFEYNLIVSDSGHHRILKLNTDGKIDLVIGSGQAGYRDGSFEQAQFNSPQGVLYHYADGPSGFKKIYIADTGNHALRVADLKTNTVTTLAGTGKQGYERNVQNGPALSTPLASPWDLAFYPDSEHIVIAMAGTHQLWSYDLEAKTLSVIAGNGRESIDDGRYPFNSLSQPSGLAPQGNKLYFVDSETSSLRVLENGNIKTLIGTGLFDFGYHEGKQGEALMQHAIGVYADSSGVYVADSYNHSIRRYDPQTGVLSNFAGHGARGAKDGLRQEAEFNEPNAILGMGGKFYIADTNNNALRVIDGDTVSTLAITQPQSDVVYATDLPNLENLPTQTVGSGLLKISIGLKPGWHINEEAPSYLALFDNQHNVPRLLAYFPKEKLRQRHITLPSLAAGQSYFLQGTLYYCEDKAGSQCLLKSISTELIAAPKGKAELALKIN